MGILSDIRDNNVIQPNRMFSFRGDVAYIERETEFTKILLNVFSYDHIGEKPDEIVIFFKGSPKKLADRYIEPFSNVLVMGDIVMNNGAIFFNGKVVEIFKEAKYATDNNRSIVGSRDANYNTAY